MAMLATERRKAFDVAIYHVNVIGVLGSIEKRKLLFLAL